MAKVLGSEQAGEARWALVQLPDLLVQQSSLSQAERRPTRIPGRQVLATGMALAKVTAEAHGGEPGAVKLSVHLTQGSYRPAAWVTETKAAWALDVVETANEHLKSSTDA